jgi:dihydrodipicolinate synthase/N-acetylneuraminate lyase
LSRPDLEPLAKEVVGQVKLFTTFRAFTTGLTLGGSGGFINVFALPYCAKMWELWQKGERDRCEQIQTLMNEVFPRGGEDNKKHIGTTKMAASVVTGVDMGAPRSPYQLPPTRFEQEIKKALPALVDLCGLR